MRRDFYTPDHEAFRETVRTFARREVVPHQSRWEREQIIDRDAWRAAGRQGIIGIQVPVAFGGAGISDYRFRCVVMEEFARVGAGSLNSSFALQDDVAIPYLTALGTSAQCARWLPAMAMGESIGAIAITEPSAGSDLHGIQTTAVRDGSSWVINGSKTFVTNGSNADVIITACRTSPGHATKALSLIVVDGVVEGLTRSRPLAKVGQHGQDTTELFFSDARVPTENLLGREGTALLHLMKQLPRERMTVAVQGLAAARAAIDWTVEYTKTRTAFGKPVASFQNTQFELAAAVTEVDVLEAYLDKAVLALNVGDLTPVDAAKAKLWASEVQNRVIDRCLQLFGGYGYMMEYPIARAFVDARATTIYAGTSEIMKMIIGRDVTGL